MAYRISSSRRKALQLLSAGGVGAFAASLPDRSGHASAVRRASCLGNDVVTFGADPTATRDSTAAFFAAMNALPTGVGIVCIPAGRYRIDGAPLKPTKGVSFIGAGGAPRSGETIGGVVQAGSATTLIMPSNSNGFVIDEAQVRIANLAIIRTRASGGPDWAMRGIYARRPFYAENLYLLRWERGIDLDGRPPHNVNGFRIENIFAEDCYWATYTRGHDAQGGRFQHIYAFQCEAGIYDSSTGGNGYADCYVEHALTATSVPYYIDNQSQLRNCRCESRHAAQIARDAQVIGGSYNVNPRPAPDLQGIVGIPARIVSAPFAASGFSGGEQITIKIDRLDTTGPETETQTVTFQSSDQTPAQVAVRINLAFPGPPLVATVDVFDNRLILQGRRPARSGLIEIAEVGTGNVLPSIGFPVPTPGGEVLRRKNDGRHRTQIITAGEVSGLEFRAASGPGGRYGNTEQIQVGIAPRGDVAMRWQARGDDPDSHEHSIIRDRTLKTRRWALARASNTGFKSLAFTHEDDELGADQVLSYRGFWLYKDVRSPAVLLSNGAPGAAQGRDGDFAWDMSTNPPTRYQKSAGVWSVVR